MNKRGWSVRVVVRYTLFQLPGLAVLVVVLILVQRWIGLPGWFVWGIVALWVAKDIVFFPFVWRAYDRPKQPEDVTLMVGAAGGAEDRLSPSGYVRVRGELWKAEVTGDSPPINRGERVRVEKIRGLTLLVRLEDEEREK